MGNKLIAVQEIRKVYKTGLIVVNNYGSKTYEAVLKLENGKKAKVTQCRGKIIRRVFP
jgi:hypothetical protein